ncbi:hypothetical protein KL909_005260 [Ogataea angusta]|nr:hypothetical protein KL909_005260 [Ogataea angusta]
MQGAWSDLFEISLSGATWCVNSPLLFCTVDVVPTICKRGTNSDQAPQQAFNAESEPTPYVVIRTPNL